MKVNLRGLFNNAMDASPGQKPYYRAALSEVYGHIQDVVDGKATVQEFADLYCIKRSEDAPASPPPDRDAKGCGCYITTSGAVAVHCDAHIDHVKRELAAQRDAIVRECAKVAEAAAEPVGRMPEAFQTISKEEAVRATVRATRSGIASAIRALSSATEKE